MLNSDAIKNEFIFFLKEKLHFNDGEIYISSDKVLTVEDENLIKAFIKQKNEGIPLDYILNSSKFYEYEFFVDSRVLIPRPETEIIVNFVNSHFSSPIQVLDAGTGSGCIGISIALKNPSFQIYGSDYSEDAIDVASINKNKLGVKNFLLIHANWLSCFKTKCFDLVISNPPYIAEGDSHLEKLVHEPNIALVSKEKGLFSIKKIVEQSRKVLKKGGMLMIEHGYDQQDDVGNIFKKNNFSKIEHLKDFQSLPRITIGTLER
jgi:release factor glutamine methyltransferase